MGMVSGGLVEVILKGDTQNFPSAAVRSWCPVTEGFRQ